jgi:hypothetical protein
MLPIVFDWKWLPDRIIFMGYFWLALTIVGLGLTVALIMTLRSMKQGGGHGHEHGGH